MKVFVAGATGVLGRRAVERLLKEGHEVTGVARGPDKASLLERFGARPATVDLFEPDAVEAAVAGHDAVCNLATHIPPMAKAMGRSVWAENDRIRRDGSRNLVQAALATGAARYVQESITFLYEDAGDRWIDESGPLRVSPYAATVTEAEAQADRFTRSGGSGVVLRFSMFYGPDSTHTRDAVSLARRRLAATVGTPGAYLSSINTDDAASAVVAALGAAAGIYNVSDDEPLTRREHFRVLAESLGVRPPRVLPRWVTRLGGNKAETLGRSQRISNARFKEATGWSPLYPSVREGWPVVVAAMTEGG